MTAFYCPHVSTKTWCHGCSKDQWGRCCIHCSSATELQTIDQCIQRSLGNDTLYSPAPFSQSTDDILKILYKFVDVNAFVSDAECYEPSEYIINMSIRWRNVCGTWIVSHSKKEAGLEARENSWASLTKLVFTDPYAAYCKWSEDYTWEIIVTHTSLHNRFLQLFVSNQTWLMVICI